MQATALHTAPLFAASLTPYRAMGPRGILAVVGIALGFSVPPGLILLRLGAWPAVLGMALGVAALYVALRLSLRDGRRREEVTLWADALEVRQVDPRGAVRRARFNPFFVRLDVERDTDDRTTHLRLETRDGELEIGAFLNPDDKASFARAFAQALYAARR